MSNISFANPYLLFLIIPLLLICFIPFFIAIRKDNRTINHVISLIFHVVISILVTLVMARFTYELVVTETNIYVLADVSYSANNNLDLIDDYILDLKENAPKNSKLGVVAFAKDYEILNKPGEKIRSVKESSVDKSATNINEALTYTGTLFDTNVIKRIVIISDGKETNKSNIVSVVESLSNSDIYIDAIYLDNNMKPDIEEIQISQIDFNSSTYLNKEEYVDVLIESSVNTQGILSLEVNSNKEKKAVKLTKGMNIVKLPLDTKLGGSFDYILRLEDFNNDTSAYNNTYRFTQNVASEVNVLFIGKEYDDFKALRQIYPLDNREGFKVDSFVHDLNVPYTVEELCKYDEIVLSNVDIRQLYHSQEFIKSLDLVVSEFGKRVLTLGNTFIQKEDDETLNQYSHMLPLDYGNKVQDQKMVAIVLDISTSMGLLGKEPVAKAAAKAIIDLLNVNDRVMIVGFYGDTEIIQTITDLEDKEELKQKIDSLRLMQGTYIGTALDAAFKVMNPLPYTKKEVMLISDGLTNSNQFDSCYTIASKMKANSIILSSIHIIEEDPKGVKLMKDVASNGGGQYYFAENEEQIKDLILTDIADDLTDTIIEGSYELINKKNSELLDGVNNLPAIGGFYFNKPKNHTDIALKTKYTSPGGVEYEVPIYASWKYGNGVVSSFATDLNEKWTAGWKDNSEANKFYTNLKEELVPDKRITSPFIINVEFDGSKANLSILAPSIKPGDKLSLNIKDPNGKEMLIPLLFDSERYVAKIDADDYGKYSITLNYTNGNLEYNSNSEFNISYSPEYDSFTKYEASNLYHMVSQNGKVSEDGKLELINDLSKVESYSYDFTILFMVICAVLYVADICVRKLRLEDIKSFFKIKRKGENK